jgi:hypothetical protein
MMKMIEEEDPNLIFVQEPHEYKTGQLELKRSAEYLLREMGNIERLSLFRTIGYMATLITQTPNEGTVFLEIIHENLKFFAASM